MRRVLIVSPHFPPDTSAGAHRVRLLAPHFASYGWEPTIIAVDPRGYEGRLDPDLAQLVPNNLRVIRCRAAPARWARRLGFGDLGLRALPSLYATASALLRHEPFDALFITIFPTYPAVMGPLLKRRFRIPFILDYIDPWVGAWGLTVGPGANGNPDLKSRATRALAKQLERFTVRSVDAISAVSAATYEHVRSRNPCLGAIPCGEVPYGGELADFEHLRAHPRTNPYFDPTDGNVHLCYVGTLLPLGFETLRAVLRAAALVRSRQPALYARLRLHFFGTSNQTAAQAPACVLPVAREIGVDDCVTEVAPRIDYLDALTVLTHASGILMLGSSEPHYTASKLYPGLLAKRPILAVYHAASSVVEVLRRVARPPTARLVTYDDTQRAEASVESIYTGLTALVGRPVYDPLDIDFAALSGFSAECMAGKLAALLDEATRKG